MVRTGMYQAWLGGSDMGLINLRAVLCILFCSVPHVLAPHRPKLTFGKVEETFGNWISP